MKNDEIQNNINAKDDGNDHINDSKQQDPTKDNTEIINNAFNNWINTLLYIKRSDIKQNNSNHNPSFSLNENNNKISQLQSSNLKLESFEKDILIMQFTS